ncbi:hypothetical protein ElyMa_001371900 [Elysia marginata]|uniref:Uncharacterized protein n=1 Tax=Elysia marginata TaxID=1093978 RepID=A0AAV4ITX7_9GAST|nr:hypothetical protein ElyMa_001371900 [Elysia marginata]
MISKKLNAMEMQQSSFVNARPINLHVFQVITFTSLARMTDEINRLCGLAVKKLAQRCGGTVSIPGQVKPKTLKLVLVVDPPGVWHYGFSAKSGRSGVRIM